MTHPPITLPDSRLESVVIGLGVLFAGVAGIIAGLVLWSHFPVVPAINWTMAVLSGLGVLYMTVWVGLVRRSPTSALPFVVYGLIYTVTGFFYGIDGWLSLSGAAWLTTHGYAWLKRRL